MSTILVTGGSGFVASHCLLQLLNAGHDVRTTVRNLEREADVRAVLRSAGADAAGRLRFFPANLENDSGWPEAAAGCDYVLHVASPFPAKTPKHEDEIIIPARDGTLRVLRAARDAGVKRVVLTSSFAAIGYGHAPRQTPFDETDWTNTGDPRLAPYPKSKTLAERAAWDFIAREGNGLELSVINPVAVFGPVLSPDLSASVLLVQRLVSGKVPAVPRLSFGMVDARDVADLHVRAMTHPAAKGERFLAVAGEFMWILDMAKMLKARFGDAARNLPTRQVPNWMVRLAALRNVDARQIVSELGKAKSATSEKARRLLGWSPRSNEVALVATVESLQRLSASPSPGFRHDSVSDDRHGDPLPVRVLCARGSLWAGKRSMAVNVQVSKSAHQKILAHLRTLRGNLEQARGALMHYKEDRVDRDKLEPAARRVDELMNLFATGLGDPAQGMIWMTGIQEGVGQVTNPKSAAALRDAGVQIAELVAVMKTLSTGSTATPA